MTKLDRSLVNHRVALGAVITGPGHDGAVLKACASLLGNPEQGRILREGSGAGLTGLRLALNDGLWSVHGHTAGTVALYGLHHSRGQAIAQAREMRQLRLQPIVQPAADPLIVLVRRLEAARRRVTADRSHRLGTAALRAADELRPSGKWHGWRFDVAGGLGIAAEARALDARRWVGIVFVADADVAGVVAVTRCRATARRRANSMCRKLVAVRLQLQSWAG